MEKNTLTPFGIQILLAGWNMLTIIDNTENCVLAIGKNDRAYFFNEISDGDFCMWHLLTEVGEMHNSTFEKMILDNGLTLGTHDGKDYFNTLTKTTEQH